ncbi:MAG: (2Fe-2S)-binding protein [Pseudohongiella sp.]|nr:(2Fe-2S)-binding protein [Pseudohongiella sp.]MDO9520351.1 (2Fe-2S)-binding protein [Pseudohongiella sp.]MDP2126372.1 (2Fe-2S)-binding protein [Pseudohongiella sp.]
MYVCICRQITDKEIRQRCEEGVTTFSELRAELGLASDCGRCGRYAREIIAEVTSAAQCRALSYAA